MVSHTYCYKSIWLSDLHLGSKDCKADYLLDMLSKTRCDTLYLVGDIIDIWALERRFSWPAKHNQVIDALINKANNGTRVIYLPGNHDEKIKKYLGMTFAKIEIHPEIIHTTVSGQKLLITHGDVFDGDVCLGKWQSILGDLLYDLLLFLNRSCFRLRKLLGCRYWSLAGYIKNKVKGANDAIKRYQLAAVNYAKKKSVDGIICGHIHQPDVQIIDNCLYCNDGDWIENCTLLAENLDGSIELIFWTESIESITQLEQNISAPNKQAA